MKKTELKVKQPDELLNYLLNNLNMSRNKLKALLKYNNILVNGRVIKQFDYKLKENDKIVLNNDGKKAPCPVPIIYEDDNYLVLEKKSGLLTIATDREKDKTLYHIARQYVKSNNKNNNIFIVHRLDKDTSGIVLFVKNEKLKFQLQEDWNNCVKKRSYVAIVEGILEKKQDKLISYLIENQNSNMVYSTKNKKEGKVAITNYKVNKETKKYSLVDIIIETGRKNQIRVQFNDINHKIVGDKKYGQINEKHKRLYLHSNELVIIDPITKEKLSFTSKVPTSFKELLK